MKLWVDIGITVLAFSRVVGVAAQGNPAILAYAPTYGPCPANFNLVRLANTAPVSASQPPILSVSLAPASTAPAPTTTATTNATIEAVPAANAAVNTTDTQVQYLNADEAAYVTQRKNEVLPGAWTTYLASVNATGVQLPDYIAHVLVSNSSMAPTLAIAQSGGGLRAAIVGAGIMNALDGRNTSSVAAGTGGLLQAASYISGLSGGAWLLTSLSLSDYPSLYDLVLGTSAPGSTARAGWLADYNVFQPTAANDTTGLTQYITSLLQELAGKRQGGFPVTFADMWSRALSRHFVPGTTLSNLLWTNVTHGAGVLFSDISKVQGYTNHQQPFPIIVVNTDSKNGDKSQISPLKGAVPLNNPIYEFTPYEFGSYDPILSAFAPTKYLGSKNSSVCVTRYDQAAFIEGISSNLWEALNTSSTALATSLIGPVWNPFNATYYQAGIEQISAEVPNPFKGVGAGSYIDSNEDYLSLVDGGHTGENVPLQPLLVKARGVDTIFIIDVSADTSQNFAAGQSIIVSKNRTTNYFSSAYSLPDVPSTPDEFISQGLTTRPTFFGCNTTEASTPLLIYVANGGPAFGQLAVTNDTSFDFNYPDQQIESIFAQSFSFATTGISPNAVAGTAAGQADPEWPACLACAVADRARERAGISRSGVCVTCFERYCWNKQA